MGGECDRRGKETQFEESTTEKASTITPRDWSDSQNRVLASLIGGNSVNFAILSDRKQQHVTMKPRATAEVQKGADSCRVVCGKPSEPLLEDDVINEEEKREGHGCMKKGEESCQSGKVKVGGGAEAQSFESMNMVIGSFRKKKKGGGQKDPLTFGLGLRHLRMRATGRPHPKRRTELKLAGRGLATSSEDRVERGLKPAIGAAQRIRPGHSNSAPTSSSTVGGGCASSASIEERGSTEMNRDGAPTEKHEAEGRGSKPPPPANTIARSRLMEELEHDCLGAE
ncbi:hypothetical protein Ancab_031923 [Ancistrocladus abbreviatus]